MIAVSIIFNIPKDINFEELYERAHKRAKEVFLNVEGLRTKAFVLDRQNFKYGGWYIFDTIEQAKLLINSDLMTQTSSKFGPPEINFFELPAFIENHQLVQ